jgi:hypothetical protein
VVDADATGRAFPEAQMTSFAIAGLPMFPIALADIRDNEVIIARAAGWEWIERIGRNVCTAFGSIVATCDPPRTGAEVKRHGILGTVTQAVALGRAVREARRRHDDPVAAAARAGRGCVLFRGKVVELERRTTDGFLRGTARLEGVDTDHRGRFEVAFQNEYLAGWHDAAVAAATPDLICLLDADSGEAIGSESLRYGQRVRVAVLPAPSAFRAPEGLALVGPRAFGYDFDYRPGAVGSSP